MAKERPILFSGPMVRALLDGRKTQTRRLVSSERWAPCLDWIGARGDSNNDPSCWGFADEHGDWWALKEDPASGIRQLPCRYGAPGDYLYVRETWAAPHDCDHLKPREIPRGTRIHYSASGARGDLLWRPSIHMPRWASRILLEITGVRAERLQQISEADAEAEGVPQGLFFPMDHTPVPNALALEKRSEAAKFCAIWQEINGPKSWAADPWVWVVEFKVLSRG